MSKFYCVIPARGGSRRIPKKNIQEVSGIPMLGHVIEIAKASGIFESIYVSTDSIEIKSVATRFGALVPYLRDSELSDDITPTKPVIADLIIHERALNNSDSVIACIYPFAILLEPRILQAAAESFKELVTEGKFLTAIQKFHHPIQRAFTLDSQKSIIPISPESLNSRTQDLAPTYHDAGQFYFASATTWLGPGTIIGNSFGFELSKYKTVDVDSLEDLVELRSRYSRRDMNV